MSDDLIRCPVCNQIRPQHDQGHTHQLSPERAVRILRAKGAELERFVLSAGGVGDTTVALAADLALVAQLLANHIEHAEALDARILFLDAERQGMAEHLARLDVVIAHPMQTLNVDPNG